MAESVLPPIKDDVFELSLFVDSLLFVDWVGEDLPEDVIAVGGDEVDC